MGVEVRIKRNKYEDVQTLGSLTVVRDGRAIFSCVTLELDWENNKKSSSCIPADTYTVKERHTPERGRHFIVMNVPGRSYILFHPGTYNTHTLGCIMLGSAYSDLNKDGYLDLLNSKATFKKFLEAIPEKEFKLTIE